MPGTGDSSTSHLGQSISEEDSRFLSSVRHVRSRSQDRCGDEKINASAMNQNPVLQSGACEGMELTT